jgi:hypothetical protein
VIQEALGPNAVNVFPPGVLVRPLIVPVHQYADAMLDYFAKRGNESTVSISPTSTSTARASSSARTDEAREELKKARALIKRCGYHRRDEELRDAEPVIL